MIDANQAGNGNYNAAPQVQQSLVVNKAGQTINFAPPASPILFAPNETVNLSATGGASGKPVVFTIDASSTGTGSISGTTLTVTGAGSFVIDANQAGNVNYSAAPQVQQTLVVVGSGATVVGNTLYLVGGNTNDQVQIQPIGSSNTGSTGITVQGSLNGVNLGTLSYKQAFSTIDIVGYNGNDNINLASSLTISTVISEGSGNENVQLGNGNSTITLGNGNENIQAGNGNVSVTAGKGNENIQLGNGTDTVTLGDGNNNVQLGNGNHNTVTLGNGNNNVQLGNGSFIAVTLGDGHDNVQAGSGTGNVLKLGEGKDNVKTGTGWSIN